MLVAFVATQLLDLAIPFAAGEQGPLIGHGVAAVTLTTDDPDDPEIPADIYELGLVYKVDIEDDRTVKIDMTLTAPGCPVAGEMPGWVQNAVSAVEGVSDVEVNMVFDPPWSPDRMSEEAKVAVGWY